MRTPHSHYTSSLGRLQPNSVDLDSIKKLGWQEQGILVVSAYDARLDFMERQLIRRLGKRLYGAMIKGDSHG